MKYSLLPSGSICVIFCLRGLNHRQFFLLPHYHLDVDVSRHTQCHLTQISAWSSVESQCFVICYLVICFSKEIVYTVHMSQVTITYTVLYYWIDVHSKLCDKGCLSALGKDTGLYLTRKYSWWYIGSRWEKLMGLKQHKTSIIYNFFKISFGKVFLNDFLLHA